MLQKVQDAVIPPPQRLIGKKNNNNKNLKIDPKKMNKFVCLVVNAEVTLDVEHFGGWGAGGKLTSACDTLTAADAAAAVAAAISHEVLPCSGAPQIKSHMSVWKREGDSMAS